MDLDKLGEDAKKENLVSIMAKMSKTDGDLHPNEFVYIMHLCEVLGVPEDKMRSIINEPDENTFIPTEEVDRMTILYYLIFLIKVDGNVSDHESDTLHHYGLKLGFNPLMISNIISLVKASKGKPLGTNDLINEIKKFLN